MACGVGLQSAYSYVTSMDVMSINFLTECHFVDNIVNCKALSPPHYSRHHNCPYYNNQVPVRIRVGKRGLDYKSTSQKELISKREKEQIQRQ